MIFKFLGINFDYMVGSIIDGFETMVGLSDEAHIAVLEGDEYLTSALDKRPKFLFICLILQYLIGMHGIT